MMDEMMRQMMGGFGLLAALLNILLTLGILYLVVWGVLRILSARPRGDGGGPDERTDPAEEILRERFARGEIDADEYDRSLATLRGEPGQRTPEDSDSKPGEQR